MTQATSPVLFPPFLLATDGSPNAYFAQKLLATMSRSLATGKNGSGRSQVTVLTVKPRQSSRSNRLLKRIRPGAADVTQPAPPPLSTVAVDPVIPPALVDSSTALTETFLTGFPPDLSVTVQVKQGRPATEILNYARTIQAGLIAVGSRGTGGVRELLLGSVSSVVARYSPCSVLVARGTTADSEAEPTLNHVLLVVQDSQPIQGAIAATRQLIPAGVQRVTILCAQPPLNADYLFGPFVAPNPSWQLNQSLQAAQNERSEHILQQARTALNLTDLEIQTLRQTGEPGPLICQVAQQQQVNLIILGTNAMRRQLFGVAPGGRNLAQRSPLPTFRKHKPIESDSLQPYPTVRNARLSTTEDYTIHHAPCPVLLCRSPLGQ